MLRFLSLLVFPSIYYYIFIISRTISQAIIRILAKEKPGLKIIHLNAQSLAKKIEEFRFLFINSNINVICVSKTWLVSDVSNVNYVWKF